MVYFTKDPVENLDAVLYDRQGLTLLPGGGMVPAGARAIREGDIIARATGGTRNRRFVVAKSTELRSALGASATTANVDDAHAFEIGDSVVIASLGSETITAIDYDDNEITFGNAPGAADLNDAVVAALNDMDEGVAIALTAVRDGNNPSISPVEGDFYVTAALTGRFKIDRIRNFNGSGRFHTDFAGRYQADYNMRNGIYIISEVSANFALT